MTLLNLFGIATAYAAAPAAEHPSATSGLLSMLPMLILFIAVFYFLLVRPQQKRAKEQRELDRKSTRLNSSHSRASRMPSSA